MTKLVVAFRNFATAPKHVVHNYHCTGKDQKQNGDLYEMGHDHTKLPYTITGLARIFSSYFNNTAVK